MTRWRTSALAGALACVAFMGLLLWLNSRETASRTRDLQLESHLTARQFASRMEGGLREHLIALGQMANFWENSEEVTEQEFYEFASLTFKLTPLCFRISVIDPSLHVRWVYPPESNQSLVGFDVRTHPEGLETLLRAEATKETALSPPLKLVGGAQGFVLTAPLFKKGESRGAVVCSFLGAHFFDSRMLPEVLARYDQMVLDSGVPLFASGKAIAIGSPDSFVSEKFPLAGRVWEIRVKPREEVIRARLYSGRSVLWILGSILALLTGGAAAVLTWCATGAKMRLKTQGQTLTETRQRLDGAMQQLLQAEKMTALGELVAGVAHEVNNPLASIMGYSQLALAQDISPPVRRYLETACAETERAGKIVRNLLTFARKQSPEKAYLGLNGIIEKTLDLKAYHFRSSQIEVIKKLEPNLPQTMLDFHQIQQVLLNLLNNAEQAILEGGRSGTIQVQTAQAGECLEIRITDNGPGIPPEIQNRVFEPFFTTKKEGKGTGLGLSLCYGILQEHGGSIRIESQPREGATFIMDLPIVAASPVIAVAVAVAAPEPTPASVPRLRVLIIDDEPNIQGFLAALLTRMGHRVDTASDVPEALRKIAANGHQLIITDMKMPSGTGKDIYGAVVEKSPRLARRIIFTTGDGASAETRQFVRERGNEIVLKPFKIEEIERAITSTLTS
jgi:signal transduction histidine kinase/CheY-like chemotaxis protein